MKIMNTNAKVAHLFENKSKNGLFLNYFLKLFHKLSSGNGATTLIIFLDTGCTKDTLRANNDILPSGLLRFAPYFRSPLIGQPIFDNWQRI